MARSEPSIELHLAGVIAGDERAIYHALLYLHSELHRYVCFSLDPAKHRDIAPEDIVQCTWITAYRCCDEFTSGTPDDYLAWLKRIAINRIKDAVKRNGRRKRGGDWKRVAVGTSPNSETPSLSSILPDTSTPSREMQRREFSAAFKSTLSRLSEKERVAFTLRYLESLRWAEVAARMNCSQRTAQQHYRNATARIREMLDRRSKYL